MLLLDGLGLGQRRVRLSQAMELFLRCKYCRAFIDDRAWTGNCANLRHPLTDIQTLWILVTCLYGRRVDAQRVGAGRARLHLHLAPVDAGLEIEELSRQKQPGSRHCSHRW